MPEGLLSRIESELARLEALQIDPKTSQLVRVQVRMTRIDLRNLLIDVAERLCDHEASEQMVHLQSETTDEIDECSLQASNSLASHKMKLKQINELENSLSIDELVDGQVCEIGNPFVNISHPRRNMTAVGYTGPGLPPWTLPEFQNSNNDDPRSHWRFLRFEGNLWYIQCVAGGQNGLAYDLLSRVPDRRGGIANVMGKVGDNLALWYVDHVGYGFWNICDPSNRRSMIHVRGGDTSLSEYAFYGPPKEYGAGDVRFFAVS